MPNKQSPKPKIALPQGNLCAVINEALKNVTELSDLDDALRLIEERRTFMTKITIKKGDKVSLTRINTAAALRPYIGRVYEVIDVDRDGQCIINIKNQDILCSPQSLVLVEQNT